MIDLNFADLGKLDAQTQLQVVLPAVRKAVKDLDNLRLDYLNLASLYKDVSKKSDLLAKTQVELLTLNKKLSDEVKKLSTKKVSQLSLGKKK